MLHLSHNKSKLLARVRRLKGQLEAVERLLDTDAPCADVLNLVASMRGAINGLTAELIEDHIRQHVMDPHQDQNIGQADAAAELIAIIRTYLK